MRPVNGESSGPAPPERVPPFPVGSLPLSEMSLLQSLGPVQSWLSQELEKCGIDAMIYTRYILSLLLHDSYDYDLQDQENDIFLGWEKGAGKKWGKSRRKGGSDLSLEEMKKQAAVQCLRSASDENSGIESLVEELCSKLKDLQNKQKEKEKLTTKKPDESRSPELSESPSSKDQVEMYYEAFPPLSEKPVCLQEIMTVWNKSKACTYSSSSSSAAPQTSTDTSSPKDCTSEGEVFKDKGPDSLSAPMTNEKAQQRRSKKEKENRYHGGTTGVFDDQATSQNKKQARNRSDLGHRPRSWSSGSSEGGSSSSGNHGESKTFSSKGVRFRHKSREVSNRKKGRSSGQVKLALKAIDKEERRNATSIFGAGEGPSRQQQHYMKKGKRSVREVRKDPSWVEAKESGGEAHTNKEYMEEPLWYTEPISEYFVPFSRSKLETKYRSKQDSPSDPSMSVDIDSLTERMHGICIANSSFERAYLAAGTFVDGHFVEVSGEGDEEISELNGISSCLPPEDGQDLDDEHLCEFTHFYEVDIYQSILDPSASDAVHESRILNMIRQKSNEPRDVEAGCRIVLDGLELQEESAIKGESLGASEADVTLTQDMENMAHMWECYSSSSSEDLEAESCAGDSPARLSPVLGSVPFNMPRSVGELRPMEACGSTSALNTCFSLFELQCDSSAFPFPCDSLVQNRDNIDSTSCLDPLANKQSRLLIWTKNSAFDETEHCSNLSTRTCSPWSHSEETRSDSEQIGAQLDESAQFGTEEASCRIPPIPAVYMDEEILDFLQENPSHQQDEMGVGTVSNQTFNKVSKLESVCGIALEQDESKEYNPVLFSDNTNQQSNDYSSGIIKDIWMAIGDKDCVLALGMEKAGENLFSEEAPSYQCCCCLDVEVKGEPIQKKAVQRSEYHLWEGQKEDQGLAKGKVSKMDGGDYTTPARPWDMHSERAGTSFILGGVYGELKTVGSEKEWTLIPPGEACGSLLQCAAATSSDVVTIAGTDVFMNAGSCFAPGHKPLWRPLVSFGQNDQTAKGSGDGLNKGFSVIFHEDLLGSCGGYCGEEQGLECPFSSLDLNNPFSQVLHVECSFEPEDMASFSPGFKPKSILCSDSDSEPRCPRLYGMNRTQYRAIRISPRTHFRPISASELSPGWCSVSDAESEKEEMSLPISGQTDLFDDPQADLKPLEEDAECEGPYYGKSELESGKFLPRLKKSGMEKSAQTSLDSQEGGGASLLGAEQEICLDCRTAEASTAEVSGSSHSQVSRDDPHMEESCAETQACECAGASEIPEFGKSYDEVPDLPEFPLLGFGEQVVTGVQQTDCWWQNTLCSSLISGSQCTGSSNM